MLGSTQTRRSPNYAGCILLACVAAVLMAVPVFGRTTVVTLVGAEDIASCSQNNDSATARLLGNIPGTVFTLGDNVYPSSTADRFRNCYDPTWGRYKARTKPTLGNHDYTTNGASAYFDYFGARAGTRGKGYYSYDRATSATRRVGRFEASQFLAIGPRPQALGQGIGGARVEVCDLQRCPSTA